MATGVALAGSLLARGDRRRVLRPALTLAALFLVSLLPMVTWAQVGAQNQATRFLYLPTLFSTAAIGSLFAAPWLARRHFAALLVLPMIVVWLLGLVRENRIWSEAAVMAEEIVRTFPEARPDEVVIVTGLPQMHRGAFVFRASFVYAAEVFGTPGARVRELGVEAWEARRGAPRGATFARWDPDQGLWVVASPEDRR